MPVAESGDHRGRPIADLFATMQRVKITLSGGAVSRVVASMTMTNTKIRDFLLSEILRFVERARTCPGVRRIALVGSLTTSKHEPKDADVLVTVEDNADLTLLATAGRRLKGRAQSRNRGADIFLADSSSRYIGRTCDWRECRPGVRAACDAQYCRAAANDRFPPRVIQN